MNDLSKENIDIFKMYESEAFIDKDDFINKFHVDLSGLSNEAVFNNLNKYGANVISANKPKRWYNYFVESLLTPFNLILLGISAVLFYTDVILAEKNSYANIIVIAILIIVSTLLDFFEEFKSNRAAEKLKELVATTATVLRNGNKFDIPIKDITVGDIVFLSAGSMVPADLRIIETNDLYVGQSSLTRRI